MVLIIDGVTLQTVSRERLSQMQTQFYVGTFVSIQNWQGLDQTSKMPSSNSSKETILGYVSVTHRVKQLVRFLEKVGCKQYEQPFAQTKDLVGLRVVCFFQSDVDRISELIAQEFQVIHNKNKKDHLPPTQFGYRSHHLVVNVKKAWSDTPNYRGLEDLKIEIQIRTILMHAWAEIEHRLAYKRTEHIPGQFRRKFSMLSAKLEEADEQFEELASAITDLKGEIEERTQRVSAFDSELRLNLDTLQAFLDYQHPDDIHNMRQTRELFDEMLSNQITIGDLVDDYADNRFTTRNQNYSHSDDSSEQSQTELARRIFKLKGHRHHREKRADTEINRSKEDTN